MKTDILSTVSVSVDCKKDRIPAIRKIFGNLGFEEDEYGESSENCLAFAKTVSGHMQNGWETQLEQALKAAGLTEKFSPVLETLYP